MLEQSAACDMPANLNLVSALDPSQPQRGSLPVSDGSNLHGVDSNQPQRGSLPVSDDTGSNLLVWVWGRDQERSKSHSDDSHVPESCAGKCPMFYICTRSGSPAPQCHAFV